ncbi:predicted protein [Naegleria gruberi]|uniref:Predicted protein n=1 Tax=Naegleria gruberi TaxID=5762 RepID=D2V927_NAEGR|nr:uncharacterized protein NAEGRDRAFT_47650 [Naegleria gruberi]EFC46793.1 predicted protein [Naegleria gruberi]|eukprot:XP_002679537.1 predicted protein [Naegleria gruberi strain NEG-M]
MTRITPMFGIDSSHNAGISFTNNKYKANNITPASKEDNNSNLSSNEGEEAVNLQEERRYLCGSIKFLLIFLISLLLLISVFFLSIIWISCFSSAVVDLSSRMRAQEFDKIIQFTKKTVNDVLLVTESVKSQLYYDFDFSNMIEHHLHRAMKVAQANLPNVTQGVYVGDPFGGYFGFAHLSGEITYFNLTPNCNQVYFVCKNFDTSENCDRGTEPEFVFPPYTSNYVAEMASTNPGNPVFTLSYVDPSLPSFVFMTMVSSIKTGQQPIKPGASFSYYFAYDMTVMSVSTFLVDITTSIHGSSSFIIETQSEFVIASDHPEVSVAIVDKDGNVERKTTATFGGQVTKIGKIVYDTFEKLTSIPCNEERVLSLTESVVSIKRFCSKEGIDWIIILSVPQWNYLGSMIIAIVSAVVGSILIVSVGIVVAIIFSLKIVRPFVNLISAFEWVSLMKLENINLYKSSFSEVKSLQFHFKEMIERIKLYRKFIPPHLLVQLDANNVNQQEETFKKTSNTAETSLNVTSSSKNNKSYSQKESNHDDPQSSGDLRSKNSSGANSGPNANMFSLYLDKRQVTLLNIYLEGLNEWFVVINPTEIVTILSEIYDVIVKLVRLTGQVGQIEDETIPIHLNATSDQSQHELKGIQLCHSLLSKLNAYKESKLMNHAIVSKYDEEVFENFKFRIVANSQSAYCGNLGTKQAMSFSIIGSSQHNLKIMTILAKELDIPILITEDLYEKVENKFQVRYVDTVQLVNDQHFSNPYFTTHTRSRLYDSMKVFELGEINTVSQDEWMYELDAKEKKKNRWKKYNDACFFFFASRYAEASNMLEEYLDELISPTGKQDIVALKLLDKCKDRAADCVESFENFK